MNAAEDTTPDEFYVLATLHHYEPSAVTPEEVARLTRLTEFEADVVLESLIEKGLVNRRRVD